MKARLCVCSSCVDSSNLKFLLNSDHLNSIWNATLDEPSNMEDSLPQVENFFSEAIKELDLPVTNPKK